MTLEERQGVIIEGLDMMDIITIVDKKRNKFIALTLQEVEQLVTDPKVYEKVRKAILDGFGEYTRSLVRALLGDIEYAKFKLDG